MRKSLLDVATFIASINNDPSHHVGYCGNNRDEILTTLQEDFKEEFVQVLYDQNGMIIGVLALDVDEESQSGEIWGPFIENEERWVNMAESLWGKLLDQVGDKPFTYYSFYNINNKMAKNFIDNLGASYKGEHVILEITERTFVPVNEDNVHELNKDHSERFISLHNESFPNTYINGESILAKLDENNKVFVHTEEKRMNGYAYVECNPTFNEGSIEFIAVESFARNRGIGRFLLKNATQFLLKDRAIEAISLCVSADNEKAISLYKSAGFHVKHTLHFYELVSKYRKEKNL